MRWHAKSTGSRDKLTAGSGAQLAPSPDASTAGPAAGGPAAGRPAHRCARIGPRTSRPFCSTSGSRLEPRPRGRGGERHYHSIYDDFKWYTTFRRHVFVYGRRPGADGGDGGAAARRRRSRAVPVHPRSERRWAAYVKEVEKLLQEETRHGARAQSPARPRGWSPQPADPASPFRAPGAGRAAALSELRAARKRGGPRSTGQRSDTSGRARRPRRPAEPALRSLKCRR